MLAVIQIPQNILNTGVGITYNLLIKNVSRVIPKGKTNDIIW